MRVCVFPALSQFATVFRTDRYFHKMRVPPHRGHKRVKCKVACSSCRSIFVFDPEQTPAQRARAKRRPNIGAIVAYYPTCPRCRATVEVNATITRMRTPEESR